MSLLLTFYGYSLSFFIFLISFYEFVQYFAHHKLYYKPKILSTYDYIVVGSGPAGSTVALRLAENGNSVLLLEAGTYSNFLYDVPIFGPALHGSNIDWHYYTESQKNACLALNDHRSHWTSGKVFGGSSRLNTMIYMRGHRKDFSTWFIDKPNYDFKEDVLKYFKKSEKQMGAYKYEPYHNNDGILNVDDIKYETPLANAVLEGAKLLGFPKRDINAQITSGFMKPQLTAKNGKRWTIADTIKEKNLDNIQILTGAQVLTLLFKGYHEAYGVSFDHFGQISSAIAKKGIILSAGTIGTPKILLQSGIGPEKHLASLGIDVRKDLPVGENLQDHIVTGLDLVLLNETLPLSTESLMSIWNGIEYFWSGTGPWTTSPCEVIGIPESYNFYRSPKLEIMVLPLGISTDSGLIFWKNLNMKTSVWKSYFEPLVGKQVISIVPVLLHPESRGYVRLRSSDLYAPPAINPNYLTSENDIKVLIEGIDFVKKLIATPPMQKLGAHLNPLKFPGCEHLDFDTPPYWTCYIQHLTMTTYHPVGTCKMGHIKDPTTVVDYEFKVKGIDNLFVVDASVMPTETSGNIQAAVAMLGERFVDVLLHKDDGKEKKIETCGKMDEGAINMLMNSNICDSLV